MNPFTKAASAFLKIPPEKLRDELTPADIPNWDSMNYLLFVAELEKAYGISFTMDEVIKATCLGDIKAALILHGVSV